MRDPGRHVCLCLCSSMTVPVSLSRLLSRARNAKGLPPESILTAGVICLSPAQAIRLKANVLDIAVVCTHEEDGRRDMGNSDGDGDGEDGHICVGFTEGKRESYFDENRGMKRRVTIAHIWPLDVVDDGFAALDDHSLAVLGFDATTLPLALPSLQSPRRTKKLGKNTARRRASGTDQFCSSPLRENTGNLHAVVHVSRCSTNVAPAKFVCVALENDLPRAITYNPFVDALRARLSGRALVPGMLLPISILGLSRSLCIASVDGVTRDEAIPRRVVATTDITLVPKSFVNGVENGAGKMDGPSLLDCLGGVEEHIARLKELLLRALHLRRNSNGKMEEEKIKEEVLHVQGNSLRVGPRAVLLYGAPGTGKTALAMALAEWTAAHLEIVSCPSVAAQTSGEAVRSLENSFARARRHVPAVVVLDDVDAIAPRRDSAGVDPVSTKLTAALLTALDASPQRCAIIATTVRRDALDIAVRRFGRLDVEIELPVPDTRARSDILLTVADPARNAHRLEALDKDFIDVARAAHGFVAADLHAMWRDAVALAVRRGGEVGCVTREDLFHALRQTRPSALREVAVEVPETRWDDIGGKADAKRRLREIVEWPLRSDGSVLRSLGIVPPRGVLLFGPPGCSKTLLARAVATECGANFISVKGAELLSKWVGDSEKAVRRTFERARMAAPCVIFFDEVDALASARSDGGPSAHARVVAQLLHEMDGIEIDAVRRRVIVIAATNRPDCLDEAFLRPGRIDAQVYVGLPDAVERRAILSVHTRHMPLDPNVDLDAVARDTVTGGFSGAEVAALVREAALCAMERDIEAVEAVTTADFTKARTRVHARTPANLLDYFDRYVAALKLKLLL